MILSGIAKFLLGFILAIAILLGGGVAAGLYFMNKASTPPPKPIFANDTALKVQRRPESAAAKIKPLPAAQPIATPTPTQTPSPKSLEPGAYKARVIWPHGLSLRSQPNLNGEHIGSLGYNQPVVVLAESRDRNWQRIRLEDSQREGWIKTGNTQRVDKQH